MEDQIHETFQPDPVRGRLLTATQVAELWNQRAKEMGYTTHYTRFSVRNRREKGKKGLTPAIKTPVGKFYWEKDAMEINLQPSKSKSKNS